MTLWVQFKEPGYAQLKMPEGSGYYNRFLSYHQVALYCYHLLLVFILRVIIFQILWSALFKLSPLVCIIPSYVSLLTKFRVEGTEA